MRAVESAYGGYGNDLLVGSDGPNRLSGGGGNDTITGAGGFDALYGDSDPNDYIGLQLSGGIFTGADAIDARDGGTDVVDCGGDASDTAQLEDVDVASHCPAAGAGSSITVVPPKTVTQIISGPPTPGLDRTRPGVKGFKAAGSVKAKALRRTGRYSVKLTPSEAVTATVGLQAKAAKGVRIAKAGDLVLATVQRKLAGGKAATVRLTVPKGLRKALVKRRKLRLAVVLTDGGGNATTRTQTVRLR